MTTPRITFTIPAGAEATEPAEARGLARDEVRLMVAEPDRLFHTRFYHLKDLLRAGDLLVVNVSATLPAAIDAIRPDGSSVVVHFSADMGAGTWIVELRRPDATGPFLQDEAGSLLYLPDGAQLQVLSGRGRSKGPARLWHARIESDRPVEEYLARFGRPIAYSHMRRRLDLDAYQTVFAKDPGSAEMPSAARPFTHRLVTDLVTRGITMAPLVLHAGVSSLEETEPPQAEAFHVPEVTARHVNTTHAAGGRVIAVGTTVVRALETVTRPDGNVVAGKGRTELVLDRDRPAQVIDGLITGWHPPRASHLRLLEAVAGRDLVQRAYDEAVANGYLWHEFGDSCLLLPDPRARSPRPTSRPPRHNQLGGGDEAEERGAEATLQQV